MWCPSFLIILSQFFDYFVPEFCGFLGKTLSGSGKGQKMEVKMAKDVKIEGGFSGVFRPPGSHVPEMVPIVPETVNTGTGVQENWSENPFWFGFQMETRKKRAKLETADPKMLVGMTTGTKEGVSEISRVYEIDSEAFVKVYTRFMHIFFDTSKNAQKLFEVIMWKVGNDKENDCIYLHHKEANAYHKRARGTGYSSSSFYRAVDELIGKGIVARSALPHQFWINPAIFWNGDRLRFITEFKRQPQVLPPEK